MTFEEIKNLLREYKGLKRQLKSEQLRILELRQSLTDIMSVDYSKEKVSSSNKNSYIENVLDRIALLEEKCNVIIKKVFEIEDLIADNMGNLSPLEQAMIIDRYMHGYSWKRICREYNYSESQPYKIIESALRKMAK